MCGITGCCPVPVFFPQGSQVPVGQLGVGPSEQVMIADPPPPGRRLTKNPHNVPVAHPRKSSEPRKNVWVAPGEILNTDHPKEACPICGRSDFITVTDLELHSALCVAY